MDIRPIIAITMGDPAGIGAEIAVKSLQLQDIYLSIRPLIVGDLHCIKDAIKITGGKSAVNLISNPGSGLYEYGTIDVIDLDNVDENEIVYGIVSAKAGHSAYQYIEYGARLAMAGEVDAIVTGPIHKESLNLGGHPYSGHTEILADLTNTSDYAMMLADGEFRVAHVSTHVSLREACDLATKERVLTVTLLADNAMKKLGIAEPKIGIAGLNPHSGEGGLFGTEEIEEITPAITEAQHMGIKAEGPVPPDTLFAKARGGQYDIAVAMYHDQGHIAMKTAGFSLDSNTGQWTAVSGVNVTLGLPIIRVSVDHGTAFGKAGKGTANPKSMIQALELASKFAEA